MSITKHKVLIRGVNWLGDAVMTTPAIRAWGKAKRESSVALLANGQVLQLFKHDPHVESFIEYNNFHKTPIGKLKLISKLRGEQFVEALLLQNAFDAALITFLAGIKSRIGYNRDGRGVLLTKSVPVDKNILKLHQIDYFLNLIRAIGITPTTTMPWLYLLMDERLSARSELDGLKRPVIGINPGAAFGPAKRWKEEGFACLIKKIVANLGGSVVIFGASDDKPIVDSITSLLPVHIVNESGVFANFCGKTTVRQLCALISECDALVTNDSGPMHVAYAVGTPVVAIFGSTEPALTSPPTAPKYEETGFLKVICRHKTKCSPCFERVCRYNHYKCLTDLSDDYVYEALCSIIPQTKAIFFDRDGTLCHDAHYLNCFDNFKVFPQIGCLKELKDSGYKLIGITNQSGIARGIVDEWFVNDVNKIFIDKYGFDGFYYCPHLSSENCACRKPSPGLLYKARAEFGINLKASYFVGDKDSDILSASAVGAKPVFFKSAQYEQSVNDVPLISCLTQLRELL